MKELIVYQFEVAICLTVFSILYFILWKNETNFLFKRLLLFSIPIFSALIPLLDIKISLVQEQPVLDYLVYFPNQMILQSGFDSSTQTETLSKWQIIAVLWIFGVFFMLIRLLISYWKIWSIYRMSEVSDIGSYRLTSDPVQSFSFFNLIIINKSQAKTGSKDHILAHEQAHSRQRHSIDVIFFETLKMLQWFNPFIWMLTHESKQNLEFLADQEATTSTCAIEPYQYAIIHHAANSGYQLLKSQFSKTNLKNRIIMMNQPNNRNIHAGKLLVLLPVLGILFMSFSLKMVNLDLKKEISEILPIFNSSASNISKTLNVPSINKMEITGNNGYKINNTAHVSDTEDTVFSIVEESPYPSTGDMTSYYEKLYAGLNYPLEVKTENIKGKVFVEFIVQKDGKLRDVKAIIGINPACDEEAVRVVKDGPKWMPGKQGGTPVNARLAIPIAFGYDDNKETRKLSGTVQSEDGAPVIGCNVIIKGTHIGTISDGDGRFIIEVGPEHSELVFDYVGLESEIIKISDEVDYKITMKIDETYEGGDKSLDYSIRMGGPAVHPNDSSSIKIGKPMAGHRTKIGISRSLDTDSSEFRPVHISNSGITIRGIDEIDEDQRPMYIYDGKEISNEEMHYISPDDIESISVLKDAAAKALYGENAINGVVIINSKDYTMDHPKINNMKSIVRGTVSSENGDAIVGANVIIKGTTTGTATDKNGHYIVEVGPDDNTLIFSIRNMKSKEVSIKNKSEIDVTLENVSK